MRAPRTVFLLLPLALAACGGPRLAGPAARRPLEPGSGGYAVPGPASDPWGPYIKEASDRFHVPARWVREVMRQESGGHEYLHGRPITNASSGAMGLMQLMPANYAVLRDRYGLGDDPYDPHDNIVAGTGLISDLYAKYGSPAFLAAYNSSPRRLDAYLARGRALPDETVNYLASVAPRLGGAMTGPLAAYAGGESAPVEVAEAAPPRSAPPPVQQTAPGTVMWSQPAPAAPAPVQQVALAAPPPPPAAPRHMGFSLIGRAYADTPVRSVTDARWGVQVGAFADPGQARQAADRARGVAPAKLAPAATVVGSVTHPDGQIFYRARLIGITEPAADSACGTLVAQRWACLTVPPGG